MARARFVRPEFFTDEKIGNLTYGARLLFICIWTQADLHGVFEYSAKQLRVYGFAHDEGLTSATVQKWLDEIVSQGLITCFEADGKQWGVVKKWDKHQTISTREKQIGSRNPNLFTANNECRSSVEPVNDTEHTRNHTLTTALTTATATAVTEVDAPPLTLKEEKRREFLEGLGAETRQGKKDLMHEWLAAVKGLKQHDIERIFQEAKPGINWPSEFKKWRASLRRDY